MGSTYFQKSINMGSTYQKSINMWSTENSQGFNFSDSRFDHLLEAHSSNSTTRTTRDLNSEKHDVTLKAQSHGILSWGVHSRLLRSVLIKGEATGKLPNWSDCCALMWRRVWDARHSYWATHSFSHGSSARVCVHSCVREDPLVESRETTLQRTVSSGTPWLYALFFTTTPVRTHSPWLPRDETMVVTSRTEVCI